ncbi:MAG: pectin esterase, partial [Duncaniella sp.]|nr:pectin esterase [Duncaniella sp.]
FDAEVSTVDELVAALDAAAAREDNSKRFRIFIHNGQYRMPASATATKTGSDGKAYPDPTTYINTPNVSLIGESRDGVVITNTVPASGAGANVLEGIGNGDVIDLNAGAKETYLQDLTMKSAMGDSKGRDIVLRDNSDKTIAKNICLWGYQDTYVSNNENSRFYFEGGLLRGRTDFLCGKGDVYYNAVTLQMCEAGGYLAVPSKPKQYGYVFRDCEIVGETSGINGKYTLGRPWGSGTPIALFINTTMQVVPSADGWNEMSGGYPARFAEYNSVTSDGTVISLNGRKKTFGDKTNCNNPVLTKDEADFHSYERVVGGTDDWDPASMTEQAPAPANVHIFEGVITWDKSDYALLWAVCRDGKVVGFTTEPTYTVDAARAGEEVVWSVRAASEMGG